MILGSSDTVTIIVAGLPSIIAAIFAGLALLRSNQAAKNTTTPNGEKRNVAEVITDTEKAVTAVVDAVAPDLPKAGASENQPDSQQGVSK